MSPARTIEKIDVAIVGGGIGGLLTAIGLLEQPHIRVQIYEAAPQFSEIGAGVSFGPNAVQALKLIGKQTAQAFQKIVTHNLWKEEEKVWIEYRFGEGEGEFITKVENDIGQNSLHRAQFLDELVALIPKDIAHFGKRLSHTQDHGTDGVKLFFADGTNAHADCVIGADGIHSVIRQAVLKDQAADMSPTYAGTVAYRALVPMKTACDAIGERMAQNSFMWVGAGRSVLTYPIDSGKTVNVVAASTSHKTWDGPWVQKADFRKVASEFAEWSSTPKAIVELLENSEILAWSLWDFIAAPTFFNGRVAMLGDAAHASTPFQGAGAGQAIEDALILKTLFANITEASHIPKAFEAYDRIRRPRAQKVCQTSREAGELSYLRLPGVGSDAALFRKNVATRMDWIWNEDIARECEEALAILRDLIAGGN